MTAAKEKYSRGAWLYLGEKRIDAKGGRNMTFSELKKKDMICIGDGRVIGRACDVVLDPATGQALGLIVCGGCGIFRSEKSQMEIPWRQIACIGDDVILVSPGFTFFRNTGIISEWENAKFFKMRGKST